MPKEKKKAFDEKQERSTMFYYEIIGSVIIILSIIVIKIVGFQLLCLAKSNQNKKTSIPKFEDFENALN